LSPKRTKKSGWAKRAFEKASPVASLKPPANNRGRVRVAKEGGEVGMSLCGRTLGGKRAAVVGREQKKNQTFTPPNAGRVTGTPQTFLKKIRLVRRI